MVPTRRQSLATIGVALSGVAGCLSSDDPDLVVENELDESVTVAVDITRLSDGRVIVQSERSIDAGGTTMFLNPITEPDEYRIQVLARDANAGGEQTYQVDDGESFEVRASIRATSVRFTEQSG